MVEWKGIVAKGFTPDDFDKYVSNLNLDAWQPSFVVLHHTEIPRISDWHAIPGVERMRNFEKYYRDEMGWSAGPHLFVADDLIWVLTPLTTPGVHSPSWNSMAWGVEMIGNYSEEPLNPGVYNNSIRALVALHSRLNLDPATLRFHKEDDKTDHKDCPGVRIVKTTVIDDIRNGLAAKSRV